MINRILLGLFLCIAPSAAVHAADKDDFANVITFQRHNADARLGQIDKALASCNRFTELVRTNSNLDKEYGNPPLDQKHIPKDARIVSQFSGDALLSIGNLDWETQNLGFANWANSVRGYMDYQEYEIAKLKLELAQLKKEPANRIQILQNDVAKREQRLRTRYLNNDSWAD